MKNNIAKLILNTAKLTLTTTIIASLTACGGSGSSVQSSINTGTNNNSTTNSPYQGYWQSDDHSQILAIDITPEQTEQYQLNPIGCLLTAQYPNSQLNQHFGQFNLSNDQQQINWQANNSFEQRTFNRLNTLPTSCQNDQLTQASDDAELNFNWFWHAINTHYAGFNVRDIDWLALKQTIESSLTSNQNENFKLYGQALNMLADPHALIISPAHGIEQSTHLTQLHQRIANDNQIDASNPSNYAQIEQLLAEHLAQAGQIILSQYLQNPTTVASEQVIYGELSGQNNNNSAYINIRSMNLDGSDNLSNINKANEVVNQLQQLLTDKNELIIDLRFNLGGNMPAAKIIADSLATITDTAYYMSFKQTGDYSAPIAYNTTPSGQGFAGNIKILTSPITGSAAEAFIYYLTAGHSNIELIGQPTRGAQSGPIKHQLPNGWQVLIPARKITDPQGQYHENSGIMPDTTLSTFSQQDINQQQDTVLEHLL